MILPFPHIFDEFLHIFFPSGCPACGRLAVPFCEECLDGAAASPLPPFCAECGGPYGKPCCVDSVPCFAAAVHDGAARDFILALKYRNVRALGFAMGERIAAAFARPEADCVVPLPLHVGSRRAYNQTELIAHGLASRWGLPVEARAVSWAVRREPQTRRSSAERAGISPDAFAVSDSLRGRRVVLVDDVYTTGATVRAALAALRRGEARPAAVALWTRRLVGGEAPSAWPEDAESLL